MAVQTHGHLLLVLLLTIIALHTCTGQIKFDAMRTMACHTCADQQSNVACNTSPEPCPNADDACMAVVWSYPDGRQRVYKQCVPPAFCQDFKHNDCLSTRNLQRCRYCCYGPLCNSAPVYMKPARWDRLN